MANRKIQIEIVADERDAVRGFGNVEKAGGGLGRKLGKAGLLGVIGGAAAGLAGLGVAAKLGFDEFSQAAKVGAQTGAVLKSTGGAANVTRKQIEQLSGSLMKKSGVDDEAVQSGANLLLTFTKVRNEAGKGNDIFNQATEATLNMSVALGTDMKSAALLTGKALNDPVRGMTALTRSGIQFTDAQKEQVKAMVESGNTIGAQKLILGELETQFAGSAEAAGKTFPGMINIARESALNFAGDLVGKAMPHVQAFTSELLTHAPKVKAVVGDAFDTIGRVAKNIFPSVRDYVVDSFNNVRSIAQAVWPGVKNIISGVWNVIRENVFPIIMKLKNIAVETWQSIATVLKENEPEIKRITGGLKTLIQGLGNVLEWLATTIVIPILKPLLTTVLPIALGFTIDAIDLLVRAVGKVRDGFVWLRENGGKAISTFTSAIKKPLDAAQSAFGAIADLIGKIVDSARWLVENAGKIGGFFGKIPGLSGDGVVGVPTAGVARNSTISQTLWDELGLAQAMGLVLSSGYRPGAITSTGNPSLHGMYPAKAIDVAGSSSAMAAFARAVAGRPGVRELIYTPVGAWYPGVGWTRPSGSVAADHYDHVHVGSYDHGGLLLPGLTLAENRTGRPERILGPGEYALPDRMVLDLGDSLIELVHRGKARYERVHGAGSF